MPAPGYVILLAALAVAAAVPLHAQEPAVVPVDPEPAQTPESATELPDMLVTANKKEQVLRDVPASIAVVDGAALEEFGAQGMEDFLRWVPGVTLMPNEPGATKVTIRGISSELGTNATTGVLFGNVSFNDAYFPFVGLDPNPFDLYGVEVLKGPQGTLYGASALNGAVRYVPNKPEFDTFQTRYFAQYAKVTEGGAAPTYGAAINVPVGGNADKALRLTAHKRESPGYTDDVGRGLEDVNEVEQYGVRGQFAWQFTDRASLSMMVLRQDTEFADDGFADNRDGRLSRDNTPAPNPKTSVYELANAALQYDFDALSVTLEGASVVKHFGEQPDISRLATGEATDPTTPTAIFFNSDTNSLELRAASPGGGEGRWSWVAGAFWSDQPIDSGFDIYANALTGQTVLGHQRSDVAVTERAVFADLTRLLGQAWEVSLGLRGYRTTSGGIALASGPLYGGSENRNEGSVDEQGVSPKASVRWRASDDVQAYVLASRGFRVGGIQPTASALSPSIPRSFGSDTIWNYELGARTQWFADTLRADLTAFHEDWDEPQLAQRDPNNPNPVATYYDNVGGVRSDGAELSLHWLTLIDGVSATVAAAYVRTVTTVPFTTAAGVATEPGTPWPYAPEWQTATTLRYDQPLWEAWQLEASITHTLVSEAWTTLANNVSVYDYQQLDALVGVAALAGPWPAVSFGVTNLLDERAIVQNTFTGPASDVTYTRPRTMIVRLAGQF
ncbi:MAG TPA: TonB-dependent receptor [Verrucomicrobiae bacterium]|nr:TonB-dependent receptor [Verrucomicrobiae bacterium]